SPRQMHLAFFRYNQTNIMSRLTRVTIMLAAFFAVDKALALLRQVIIARQFGLSAALDAYNAANNLPDLLFALISGGALAVAFIPVLTAVLTEDGKPAAWLLFSRIANLAFLVTAALSIIIGLLADQLVGWELGIAPGFNSEQQILVIHLMRMNLIATLIFSISGLVMAGLQANQHFFLPALAPLLYNLGQIFGALILAPSEPYQIAGFQLPALGLGVDGLVYGVILGSALHLLIQVPGLIKFKFRWSFSLGFRDTSVRKVLSLLGPRVITMLLIQLIFIVRDNLASRLEPGAVTALAYGWMIQQVPETLIGTAIGTALLPTLAELLAKGKKDEYRKNIQNAVNILIGLTIPIAFVLGIGLQPLLPIVFGFDEKSSLLLMSVTRGYLVGLTGHCLLEVASRSFYAQQNARLPLLAAVINILVYITLGSLLFESMGAAGISLTDAVAFTTQAIFLLFLLSQQESSWLSRLREALSRKKRLPCNGNEHIISPIAINFPVHIVLLKALTAGLVSALASYGVLLLAQKFSLHPLITGSISLLAGVICFVPIVWKEIRFILHL
ncbi:MAG: murein biosynthesis integral membrane protein MurJ, partial [Anaerolineaceae bacterium]